MMPGWSFPEVRILIVQLSLFGDFFDIPNSLGGVEWTLRVEIVFYIYMASIKYSGLWKNKFFLFIKILVMILIFNFLPPFPSTHGFNHGLFLAYAPFLFLGVGFWLYETTKICLSKFVFLIIACFFTHFNSVYKFIPAALDSHFALLGFLLFFSAWYFRNKIKITKPITMISNITFSFYLFHKWLFDFFIFSIKISGQILFEKIFATFLLLCFCMLTYYFIEIPFNKLGSKIATILKKSNDLKLGYLK